MDAKLVPVKVDVEVPAERVQAALEAVLGIDGSFEWVAPDWKERALTLEGAIREWGWTAHEGPWGLVVTGLYGDFASGDDVVVFRALAPFVKPRGSVVFDEPSGRLTGWSFDGSGLVEVDEVEVNYSL